MADIITQEKLLELREAKEKAASDETPFPIVKDGDIAVVGDANKTEVNKHDFVLRFVLPNEDGGYTAKDVEYKDVFLKPRHAVTVQRLMTSLQPLLYKVDENGAVEDLSDEEMLEVARLYEGNVLDQIYRLVAVVLGVDERLVDYIDPNSALEAYHQIMLSYPDLVKASDSFFGFSSGKKKAPSSKG